MKITTDNLPKLLKDLRAADDAANKKVRNMSDGGSCNSDSVAFPFDRMPHPKKREEITKALESVGLHGWFRKKYGQAFLSVDTTASGQAGKRYEATQVMVKYLIDAGWDAHVDYVVD